MDRIGSFIATLHSMIGHDKTAAVIGQPPGNKAECVICRYEKTRTEEDRQAVIQALAPTDLRTSRVHSRTAP